MIQLIFNLRGFPRTIPKAKWKEIWRWKRVTQKKLAAQMQEEMAYFNTHGSSMPDSERLRRINLAINPPVLIHHMQQVGGVYEH